jgi:hypothetical protein
LIGHGFFSPASSYSTRIFRANIVRFNHIATATLLLDGRIRIWKGLVLLYAFRP